MEPFTEKDPVYQLLGKAKKVEPRAQFTQDVMRAIRQEEHKTSYFRRFTASLASLWSRSPILTGSLATSTLALLIGALALTSPKDSPSSSIPHVAHTTAPALQAPSQEAFPLSSENAESEWEKIEELDHLLAIQSTTSLTDSQIALLLY